MEVMIVINHVRELKLLELLKEKKYSSISSLSKELFVSESTIRRDIASLEMQNLVRKTKGGVLFIQEQNIEWPALFKNNENSDKKKYIADLAIDFIAEDQTIFLDSSSTCLFLAQKLKRLKNCTIITNGLTTANILSEETNLDVYSTGGKVYSKRSSMNGSRTCNYLSQCYVDIAFLSCRGLSAKLGATDFSEEESMVKQTIVPNSKTTILLVDSSKFDKIFPHQSISFNKLDAIISDVSLPKTLQIIADDYGIEQVY